jgi:hypothetical protein
VVGNIILAAGLVFLGPLPFIQMEPTVSLIHWVYAAFAFSYALVRVSTLVRSQKAVINCGFRDDTDTYNFVNGEAKG